MRIQEFWPKTCIVGGSEMDSATSCFPAIRASLHQRGENELQTHPDVYICLSALSSSTLTGFTEQLMCKFALDGGNSLQKESYFLRPLILQRCRKLSLSLALSSSSRRLTQKMHSACLGIQLPTSPIRQISHCSFFSQEQKQQAYQLFPVLSSNRETMNL